MDSDNSGDEWDQKISRVHVDGFGLVSVGDRVTISARVVATKDATLIVDEVVAACPMLRVGNVIVISAYGYHSVFIAEIKKIESGRVHTLSMSINDEVFGTYVWNQDCLEMRTACIASNNQKKRVFAKTNRT